MDPLGIKPRLSFFRVLFSFARIRRAVSNARALDPAHEIMPRLRLLGGSWRLPQYRYNLTQQVDCIFVWRLDMINPRASFWETLLGGGGEAILWPSGSSVELLLASPLAVLGLLSGGHSWLFGFCLFGFLFVCVLAS